MNDKSIRLEGEDLATFLSLYDYELYYFDYYGDDGLPVIGGIVSKSDYQVVFRSYGSYVYLVVNFPNVDDYYIQHRGFVLDFISRYPDLTFKSLSMNVYKRVLASNGDYSIGDDYDPEFSTSLFLGSYETGYMYTASADIDYYRYIDMPKWRGTFDSNNYYYVDEENPFTGEVVSVKSWVNTVSYYAEDYGLEYDTLSDIRVRWRGNGYSSGAVVIAFGPAIFTSTEVVLSELETVMDQYKEFLMNPTIGDQAANDAANEKSNVAGDLMDKVTSDLGSASLYVDENTARPDVDLNSLIGFDGQTGLSAGLVSLSHGLSDFMQSPYIAFFVAPAVPPLLVSYFVFGKKG